MGRRTVREEEAHHYGDPADKPPQWLAEQVPPPALPGPLPSDAEDLKVIIDRQFKRLLLTHMEPKEMAQALTAAAKWWEVSNGGEKEEWGKNLRGGTVRDGS